MRHRIVTAIALVVLLPAGAGAQLVAYVDSSRYDRLEGKFDLNGGGTAASFDADMKVAARDGVTQFTPRFTSNWTPGSHLDLSTTIKAGDLNRRGASTSLETRLAMRPEIGFVDRIETTLLRASDRNQETYKISFARLDTGLDLFGGNALNFRSDLRHERRGERAVTTSNLTSNMGLGRRLSLQSSLKLDDGAGLGIQRSALDTQIVYSLSSRFFKTLTGDVHRGDDGNRQMLAVKISELRRELADGSSYKLSGEAFVRELIQRNGNESRRVGFETKFSGLFSSPIGGSNSLSLKVERGLGNEDLRTASLSYNHSWTPTPEGQVELKLQTQRRGDRLDPQMDLNWLARF